MGSFNVLDYYLKEEEKEGPVRPFMARAEKKPTVDTSPDPYAGIGKRFVNALRSAFDTEEDFINTYSKSQAANIPDTTESIRRLKKVMEEDQYLRNAPVNEWYNAEWSKTPEPLEVPEYIATPDVRVSSTEGKSDSGAFVKGLMAAQNKGDATKATTEGSTEAKPMDLTIPEYKEYDSPYDMSDLEILARTIHAEAESEPYNGKLAVGAVIANRAASGKYGEGIKGVILKKTQFSPWNSWTGGAKGEQGKDMLRLKPSEDAYKAAQAILSGEYEDPTGGATHYLNPSVSKPYWLKPMKNQKRGTIKIGQHLFGNPNDTKIYDGRSWIIGLQDT